jgi:hypothetical protein
MSLHRPFSIIINMDIIISSPMARKIKPMDEVEIGDEGDDSAPSYPLPPPPGGMPPYPQSGYPPPGMPAPPPTRKPVIAGILLIVAALIMIGYSAYQLTLDEDDYSEVVNTSLSTTTTANVDISGTVVDSNNTPMAGVDLRIVFDRKNINTTTDEAGEFTLKSVPTGKQIIVISKANYSTINHKIFVETSEYRNYEDYDLIFEMEEGQGVVQSGDYKSQLAGTLTAIMRICALIAIIVSVLMIVAGYFVRKRQKRVLGMIACVMGIIFGLGAIYIPTVLSIIALYMIIKSKYEFQK